MRILPLHDKLKATLPWQIDRTLKFLKTGSGTPVRRMRRAQPPKTPPCLPATARVFGLGRKCFLYGS